MFEDISPQLYEILELGLTFVPEINIKDFFFVR